jgi:hypothetical protein
MQSGLLSDWCQKARISHAFLISFTSYLQIAENKEPTSGLEPLTRSLRVIHQALQGLARGCKSRISKPVSILWIALCCPVLRSRWCQGESWGSSRGSGTYTLRHSSGLGPSYGTSGDGLCFILSLALRRNPPLLLGLSPSIL